jgi:Carboxypeptidase regulatory-like domain
MIIKSSSISFVAIMLLIANASGESSVLRGMVKDAQGRPIPGADVRIQAKGTGRFLMAAKTDAKGRYSLAGLSAGNYRVTLVVNGAVKTSINNTAIAANETTQLNFDLTQSRTAPSLTKGKHMIWIPAFTGSRLPGRWVEVQDGGSWAGEASAMNIVRVSGEELERTIHSRDIRRGQ